MNNSYPLSKGKGVQKREGEHATVKEARSMQGPGQEGWRVSRSMESKSQEKLLKIFLLLLKGFKKEHSCMHLWNRNSQHLP